MRMIRYDCDGTSLNGRINEARAIGLAAASAKNKSPGFTARLSMASPVTASSLICGA